MPPLIFSKSPKGGFVKSLTLQGESKYDWASGILSKPAPAHPPAPRHTQLRSTECEYLSSQLLRLEEPGLITVKLDGEEVPIFVDPERGPRWGKVPDDFVNLHKVSDRVLPRDKTWDALNTDEKGRMLVLLAKKFRFWQFSGATIAAGDELDQLEEQKSDEQIEADVKERIASRCHMEMLKPAHQWTSITIDDVTSGHRRRAPGMFYGLEFPWNEDMLHSFGPEWLTKAFHTAGTLSPDNRVTKIIPQNVKITTGNNGGKFLFEVKYARKRRGVHTRLFAKVPFPLEGATRSDRLSSSVNKQPQEFYEINTSRLLESALPVKTPRFYFGDISNETSNWILITEAIAFADPAPLNFGEPEKRRKRLPDYMIEGPYDKCMDHTLRGKPTTYYTLLVKTGAMIAGMHKAGKLGPEELLRASFGDMADKSPAFFGLSLGTPSGEDPRTLKPKFETAQTFIGETGRVLFPDYVTEEWCTGKLTDLMYTVNAYSGEVRYWLHANPDYIGLTHCNLNVDNAYFWRTEEGKLQVGVFDWGNMGSQGVGQKLWWWVYCADYENIRDNLDHYLSVFVDSYAEHGGPRLDPSLLRWQVIMTAMQQMLQLMFAVPQILKMCPKGEWATIESRYDPRISRNIDGKSTLRLYLHVMNNIMRIIEEMEGDKLFQKWIDEVWVGDFKMQPKSYDVVHGLVKTGIGL